MKYYIVSVPPDVLPSRFVVLEVGFTISLVSRIVPEIQRHRWRRRFTDKFSHYIDNGVRVLIVHVDFHSKPRSLKLTRVDWQSGHPSCKTAVNIRASRNRVQMQILLNFSVDPLKPVCRERGPCLRNLSKR